MINYGILLKDQLSDFLMKERKHLISAFEAAIMSPLRWNLSASPFTPSELFLIGDSYYKLRKPVDSILLNAARMCWGMARNAEKNAGEL